MHHPHPREYMPCPLCGTSIARGRQELHRCDPHHRRHHELATSRAEIQAFEAELGTYLDSPSGRFELWYAERERRASGGDR